MPWWLCTCGGQKIIRRSWFSFDHVDSREKSGSWLGLVASAPTYWATSLVQALWFLLFASRTGDPRVIGVTFCFVWCPFGNLLVGLGINTSAAWLSPLGHPITKSLVILLKLGQDQGYLAITGTYTQWVQLAPFHVANSDALTLSPAGVEASPEIFLGEDWEEADILEANQLLLSQCSLKD